MKRLVWFTGSSGINTEVDPVRHLYDKDLGVQEAKSIINTDLDYTGRPSRRKGWQYTDITSACHSLFCEGGVCLFVTGDALTILNPDLSTTALRNVTTGARMKYAQIGASVYYTNGREIGRVFDGVSRSWSKPSTVYNVKDSTIVLSGPPVGSNLEYFNGRMFIIQMNVVWYSEAYDLNAYNLAKNFIPFESPVTMFKGVTGGVWTATRNRIAFLRGNGPNDFKYELKGLFGTIPGTEVLVDGFKVGNGKDTEIGVLFMTKYGPCFGTADGRLVPLSSRRLSIPNAVYGAGVINKDRYVVTLDSSLCIVTNISTFATWQYNNYPFNSFCILNGSPFGAKVNGIFRLDYANRDMSSSITGAIIEAVYETGPTDFGLRTEKRIRKCEAALSADGQIKITFKANEGDGDKICTQTLPGLTDNQEHAISIPVGRELKGRYFSFKLENIGGADFSINNIEAFVDILLRKPEKEGVI